MQLKFTATTPRQKIAFTVIFSVLCAGIALAMIIWPSVKTIKFLADQIYQQRIELEQLYQKGQVLKQTLRAYEEVKSVIPKLNQVYLTKGNELEFVTKLEEVAAASGVTHDLKLVAVDPKKQTNQLPFQLQNEGDLPKFIRYLAALESLDFYVNINTIRISSLLNTRSNSREAVNQLNGHPVLQAILLATAYFKP